MSLHLTLLSETVPTGSYQTMIEQLDQRFSSHTATIGAVVLGESVFGATLLADLSYLTALTLGTLTVGVVY